MLEGFFDVDRLLVKSCVNSSLRWARHCEFRSVDRRRGLARLIFWPVYCLFAFEVGIHCENPTNSKIRHSMWFFSKQARSSQVVSEPKLKNWTRISMASGKIKARLFVDLKRDVERIDLGGITRIAVLSISPHSSQSQCKHFTNMLLTPEDLPTIYLKVLSQSLGLQLDTSTRTICVQLPRLSSFTSWAATISTGHSLSIERSKSEE